MHAGGRPTSYSQEMLDKALAYLETYQNDGDLIPSAAKLGLKLGVSKATLYNWASDHPEFLDMLEAMNQAQESNLLRGGLSGDFNSTIAKLVLSKHGYSDKQEIDHTTKGKEIGIPVHQFVKSDG